MFGMVGPPLKDPGRAYAVPFRPPNFPDSATSNGKIYAPVALACYSHWFLTVLISALGSTVLTKSPMPGVTKSQHPDVFWTIGTWILVAEYDVSNCQRPLMRLLAEISKLLKL